MAPQADSALLFLMEEAGVSADTQERIYKEGFDTLLSFAGLDETTAGVRAALKQMGLDAEASLPIRKEVALLVSVWESAKSQRSFQVKQKLDASASGQARLVQTTEYAAMRAAVEKMQGRLRDKEAPSKSLVASKLEQLEDGAPVPEDLREATSFEDSAVEAYSAVVDPASNFLRIRPGKSTTTPPANPEELRLRHRRLGLAWAFVKSRHANRGWIPESIVEDFRKFSDFILGATVAGLRSADGNGPSWALVLTYELEVRKTAYRYVRDAICSHIGSALEKSCEAPALYGVHFVTPLQLGKREQMESSTSQGAPRTKGSGKGKGKWDRQWGKSAATPDGRKICFNFNKAGGCHKKHCDFAHACQRCFGKHSFQNCKFKGGAKHPAAAES